MIKMPSKTFGFMLHQCSVDMEGALTSDSARGSESRLRAEIGATQAAVAERAGLDQSRVSRIEKGDVADISDINRVLDALAALGAKSAPDYKNYAAREWLRIPSPLVTGIRNGRALRPRRRRFAKSHR